MTLRLKLPFARKGKAPLTDPVGRRIAVALAVSFIVHIAIAVFMRPEYKPVADHAVDFEVTHVKPGPPKKPKSKPETPKPEKEPEKEAKPKPAKTKKPGLAAKNTAKTDEVIASDSDDVDAGPEDAGVVADVEEGVPYGPSGTGTGICMPNLFPYSRPDATWMLWVSLASFRETALEASIGATLARFALGDRLTQTTGLNPQTDVEGVLVSAGNVFDSGSYQVVLGYDSGEEALQNQLNQTLATTGQVVWTETPVGPSTVSQNSTWNLTGSGQVLVTGFTETPDKGPGVDASWPTEVECVSTRSMQPDPSSKRLIETAKSYLGPDESGRWPVALLVTDDPRTVGLGRGRVMGVKFKHAVIRAFFSDPIVIQGEVHLDGNEVSIRKVAEAWQSAAASVSKDPFFAMAGLASLFDKLTVVPMKDRIAFSLILNEGQARAAMLFLQLQGEALERQLQKP